MSRALLLSMILTGLLAAGAWKPFEPEMLKRLGKRLMLIKVERDNCRYCAFMEQKVFSDTALIALLQKHFVLVGVNVSHEKMPLGLQGGLTPSFYLLNAKGEVQKHLLGAWYKEDFLSIMKPYMKE